ncbi:PLP-dependent aminotransferase family protein [Serratia inhibens]|uniref:PLP-dependent aminotransferase family protein n=1 Tax=Serratia inhibens TaxID=2338073 RepID=A0AA92X8F9_9GAMM|nr:PLP-dependent aminotransferase family protein [Serratia inhibens]ANS43028.1 2-aminoadipate transaminase [Serratia inhibens PRI-2C]RJF57520.1 PLP-dependent aminotransferase family protein [Serratia inhibens]
MWTPRFSEKNAPVYLLIADALQNDINNGVLPAGSRLPTLKELAQTLAVTPGTVNRAYEEAARRGLVQGEVGRGTFVLATPERTMENVQLPHFSPSSSARRDHIDLSVIKPEVQAQEQGIRTALEHLVASPELGLALDYSPEGGHPAHRDAGANWLRRFLPDVHWQQVVLTAGAQHGLLVAINALTAHQDLILCEALCYPGIISLVHGNGRRLRGVEMDSEGIVPDSLRALCRQEKPAMLICVASCQNPTTVVMSNARRAEIAQIAREFDFYILDDDIYGFLTAEPVEALSSFAPERSVYLTSLSKSISPALRIGYLHAPAETLSRLTSMVRTSIWMPSPLIAQLASNIITSGIGAEMLQTQRQEAAARQAIAAEVFHGLEVASQPYGYHIWVNLPEPWTSDEFANLARAQGVNISSGTQFLAERSGHTRAVRIVLMSPTSRSELKFALTKLRSMIESAEPRLYY